jgi:integrase
MYIKQLPSGSWRVIVQSGGRRRSGTAATRAAAERLGADLVIALGGAPADRSAMAVAELLDTHLAEHHYAVTTRAEVKRVAGLVPGWFAARPIAGVSPPVIDSLYRQLERDGWSVFRLRRLHTLLLAAFKRARRKGWITDNPIAGAEVPAEPEAHVRVPEPDEVVALLAAADEISEAFGIFCRLSATTGARRGEVCGLQWHDVDFERLELRLRRSVAYTPASGVVVVDVKTGRRGRRAIALGPLLVARLDAYRIAQAAELLERGRRPGPEGWLFTHAARDGEVPWMPDSATTMWRLARHAAGIADVRLHDLRHFAGTEIIDAGFTSKQAADRLGHSKVATTEDRYVHGRRARDREIAEHLERKLGG